MDERRELALLHGLIRRHFPNPHNDEAWMRAKRDDDEGGTIYPVAADWWIESDEEWDLLRRIVERDA